LANAVRDARTFGAAASGAIIGVRTFGASEPIKMLQAKYGLTTENIVAVARAQLGLPYTEPPGTMLEPSDR